MRKKSKLMELKRREMIEASRRMTPRQRLETCAHLSRVVAEIHRAGEAYRAAARQAPS
jgi:hypothetical protein